MSSHPPMLPPLVPGTMNLPSLSVDRPALGTSNKQNRSHRTRGLLRLDWCCIYVITVSRHAGF